MNSTKWSTIDDGFAQGESVDLGGGWTVAPVWTAEDGVSVSIESGDEPVPARDIETFLVRLSAAARTAARLAPPA